MNSSRRELRTCRWIEASLQNVYNDHKHDRKTNHSIYPDFEETLYEAVGLTKASKSRRLLCMMELCKVFDIAPSDELPTLTQEEQLQLLNEQLCDRLRPSFVGKRVYKIPLDMLKMFMRIFSHILIASLNDEWWEFKRQQGAIWDTLDTDIQKRIKAYSERIRQWNSRSIIHQRLLRQLENKLVTQGLFHLVVDDYITSNINFGVETTSRKLYERVNPKHARILTRYTIAKILYTLRMAMAPSSSTRKGTRAVTKRAKGGRNTKPPSCAYVHFEAGTRDRRRDGHNGTGVGGKVENIGEVNTS